jgi:hypothetical protein
VRTGLVGALAAALVVTPVAVPLLAAGPAAAATARQVAYTQWDTAAQLHTGWFRGTAVGAGKLRLSAPSARTRLNGTAYEYGTWTSRWVNPGFSLTEVVPSWSSTTPAGTWVRVDVRVARPTGTRSSWDTIARWESGNRSATRTSLGSQTDDLARVATDTLVANSGGFRSWQLRVLLFHRVGSSATPTVGTVGAMASKLPHVSRVTRSAPGVARGIVLDVPRYSQMVHAGEYPQYGGGGEAWCSPTSTSMVLGYYRRLPAAAEYAWVRRSYTDRFVDHAARMTFDYGYDGTGNWPFNTAYAAKHAGKAFVTRFTSLRAVEQLIRARIPVVTSITFGRGELAGAPISSTNGHLVVVVGFTKAGDVVVNDPASRTRSGVRRTYDRAQFENAWLKRYRSGGSLRGSGGLGYVIRDAKHPLPARNGSTSW